MMTDTETLASPLTARAGEARGFSSSALAWLRDWSLLATRPINQKTVLPWLIQLRWGAVVGQLMTVLFASEILRIDLPRGELTGIIGFTAVYNVVLTYLAARLGSREMPPYILPAVFILDMLALTGLLYLSGGPHNPFAVFYIVHVILAAVVLRGVWTWVMAAMTAAGYGALFWEHLPLPAPAPPYDAYWSTWQLIGKWVGMVMVAGLIAYFINKVLGALRRQELQLAQMQAVSAKNARLASLTTLAAGAAHELNTPLGTIKVAAAELARALESDAPSPSALEDVRLIRSEVERCRTILDRMHIKSLDDAALAQADVGYGELIYTLRGSFSESEFARVDHQAVGTIDTLHIPLPAVTQALAALITNALHASDPEGRVRLFIAEEHGCVRFTVEDDGHGMGEEVLARAGEPFFTTKHPGEGMGLGLFLVQATAERLGGWMEVFSDRGAGTQVVMEIPATAND